MRLLVTTRSGVHRFDLDTGTPVSRTLAGRAVTGAARAPAGWWFAVDSKSVWFEPDGADPVEGFSLDGHAVHCLAPLDDEVLVGASDAMLYLGMIEGGVPVLTGAVDGFLEAPGRDSWYTPWGGPPDVRSIDRDDAGTIYLNVHVGGILRYHPDDPVWRDTMDIHADVHEVIAHPDRDGVALAATARGLAVTIDAAETWEFRTEGLHAGYCRAVAAADETVLVSASAGSRGRNAAVYRGALGGGPLVRCDQGLPEWFSTNVNTGCLAIHGAQAFIGDEDGSVYRSDDGGLTWGRLAAELPAVTGVYVD